MAAIDAFTPEESAQFEAMRDDAPEPVARETRAPRETAPAEPDIEIDTGAPEPAPTTEQVEKQKTVPHEQFHAERERRKAVQAELQKFREEQAANNARFEERFRLLSQVQQPVQPAAPAIPDFQTDPVQHIDGRFKTLEQQVQAAEQFRQQVAQRDQQAAQINDLRNYMAAQEADFAASTPDYQAAMAHMVEQRHAILTHMGVSDPAQRQAMLANDVAQIAQQARQQGRNPAEMLYNIAAASGYRKAEPASTALEIAATAPASPAERQAANIERGRQMSTTVGTTGTAPPTRLTPERIASMSESEFSAMYAKIAKNPSAMRQLFGE